MTDKLQLAQVNSSFSDWFRLETMDDKRMSLFQLVDESIQNIVSTMKAHPEHTIIISSSGGKDSSVMFSMFAIAIRKGLIDPKRIKMVFADTKSEIPTLAKHMKILSEYAESIGIESIEVKRKDTNTYWTRFLGDGVFSANWNTRWCVNLLKLNPMQKYFKTLGDHLIATGVRVDESTIREQRYKDSQQKILNITKLKKTTCDTAGECFVNFENQDNVFHPILLWRNCDIWDFINFYDHGIPLDLLPVIYLGKQTARLGCWNCSVVSTNTVVEEMGKTDNRYIELYKIWEYNKKYNFPHIVPEDWIYIYRYGGNTGRLSDEKILKIIENPTEKDVKHLKKIDEGKRWRPSFIRLEARKRMFDMLIAAQKKTGFDLISQTEIDIIKEKWKKRDNHYEPIKKRQAKVMLLEEITEISELHLLDERVRLVVLEVEH